VEVEVWLPKNLEHSSGEYPQVKSVQSMMVGKCRDEGQPEETEYQKRKDSVKKLDISKAKWSRRICSVEFIKGRGPQT